MNYSLVPESHLGDTWRAVGYCLQQSTRHGKTVVLNTATEITGDRTALAKTILDLMDSSGRVEFGFRPDSEYILGHVALLPSVPTKQKWRPGEVPRKKIVYQFDGIWAAERKNPPASDVAAFLKACADRGYETVRLGAHLGLQGSIDACLDADFFVGACSGLAQVCYSVGIPVHLVRYGQPDLDIEVWHGYKPRTVSLTLQHVIKNFPDPDPAWKLKVRVYAIAKNETKHVDRFMDSLVDADEVIIADTGSTDDTIGRFKARGATVHSISVNPWRFDTARNKCLDLVPEDTDVCVSIDIDETIRTGWRNEIETLWNNKTNRLRYVYNWSVGENAKPIKSMSYGKIHARQGFEWRYSIHEYLFAKEGFETVWAKSDRLVVDHYPDNSKPRTNYLTMLEQAAKNEPACDRSAYYYGRELLAVDKYDECIAELKRYLSLPSAKWYAERSKAMEHIAAAYRHKKELREACSWLLRAVAEFPTQRESWMALAEHYYDIGNWNGAYFAVLEALRIHKCTAEYMSEQLYWGSLPYEMASVCAYQLGFKKEAWHYLKEALKLSPDDPDLILKKKLLDTEDSTAVLPAVKRRTCMQSIT